MIYVSSNGGVSWTQSLNLQDGRRIEMAVSPAQPTWVYAVVSGIDDGLYGVYKSTNSGASFIQIFSGTTSNLLGWLSNGSGTGGQGWYDLSLAVSPTNANTIILGRVLTWKSINGGSSWVYSNGAHVDKHMHKYTSGGQLFECNDGGIYMSADNGATWIDKSSNLSIAQMYKLGVSQRSSGEVLTGLQDNGTQSLNNGSWDYANGGDGMECIIDYNDANVQYSSTQSGNI
ncbi:MAG: hypothetical protein IPO98_18735 [Saprospiraceae bacterium]|nr:hypothetical protein [Saprospiraceae bacterium]